MDVVDKLFEHLPSSLKHNTEHLHIFHFLSSFFVLITSSLLPTATCPHGTEHLIFHFFGFFLCWSLSLSLNLCPPKRHTLNCTQHSTSLLWLHFLSVQHSPCIWLTHCDTLSIANSTEHLPIFSLIFCFSADQSLSQNILHAL